MKNILFLHGAIKNAGDFLIAHRSQMLIKELVPDCKLISVWEGENEEVIRSHLSEAEGIIFGGGPFFTHNIHPKDIPLVKNLDSINLPMMNIGGGWYGKDNRYETVKEYYLDEGSIELLRLIERSAGCLSCRDWFTVNMLKEKGFNAEMHGCPAWYDLKNVAQAKIRGIEIIKKICISDPANVNNYEAAKELISVLKERYPLAEIKFVFHRGAWGKEEGTLGDRRKAAIESVLLENNISWVDISGGYEGFSVYDSCDLHIGFRVHAHIYNLSIRNRSILLEEDGRGAGVNHALGLSNIHVYDEIRQYMPNLLSKALNRMAPQVNKYLRDEICRNLDRAEYTNWLEYDLAFSRMQFYYEQLKRHISKINTW